MVAEAWAAPLTRPAGLRRGAKAGRIVRTLVDRRDPPGVRELAEIAGVDPGYVSRIAALLDREALIERSGRGRIVSVDWPRVLQTSIRVMDYVVAHELVHLRFPNHTPGAAIGKAMNDYELRREALRQVGRRMIW